MMAKDARRPGRPRTAVVTGVTSGIGAAITARMLADGATVVGVGRDKQLLSAAADRWGARFHPVVADLGDPDSAQACLEEINAALPHLDALVNNAAQILYEPPGTLPIEQWRRLLETNLLTAINLIRGLLPALGPTGHIVNISSATARFLPDASFAPYALTKVALEEFTEALRLELRGRGPRVSVVRLGLVDTPAYAKVAGFEHVRGRLAQQIPRWLDPADVVEAVGWMLARPEHVTVADLTLLPVGQAR